MSRVRISIWVLEVLRWGDLLLLTGMHAGHIEPAQACARLGVSLLALATLESTGYCTFLHVKLTMQMRIVAFPP